MSTYERTCPDCQGTGIVWSKSQQEDDCCKMCGGDGVVTQICGAEKLTREELNHENSHP